MSEEPLNRAEKFTHELCRTSFLSLWCYANPQAANGKELCDVLGVCAPHVIILSVKDIRFNAEKDFAVAHDRWERKAVDASIAQIYGAEKMLGTMTHVLRRDGTQGLLLPPVGERQIHRIAVACGADEHAIIKSGDRGKGYVHVMTEESFRSILEELDTICDVTEYLSAKEAMAKTARVVTCVGPESNMLGWYLANERTFPKEEIITFADGIWAKLQQHPGYLRKQSADEISYAWDNLIEFLGDARSTPLEGPGPTLDELELSLRDMAGENRVHRRVLGEGFVSFLHDAKAAKSRARILQSVGTGITYVCVWFSGSETSEQRRGEVLGRLYAARKLLGSGEVLIGIGMSAHIAGRGTASDLIYARFPAWGPVEEKQAEDAVNMLGYFKTPNSRHVHEDEFPPEGPDSKAAG